MINRHGQMDQDLYIRELSEALSTAIYLLKQTAGPRLDKALEEDIDNFLFDMESSTSKP